MSALAEDLLHGNAVLRDHHRADRDADIVTDAFYPHLVLQRAEEPHADGRRAGSVDVIGQHGELIAAKARQEIGRPRNPLKALSDRPAVHCRRPRDRAHR